MKIEGSISRNTFFTLMTISNLTHEILTKIHGLYSLIIIFNLQKRNIHNLQGVVRYIIVKSSLMFELTFPFISIKLSGPSLIYIFSPVFVSNNGIKFSITKKHQSSVSLIILHNNDHSETHSTKRWCLLNT